MNKTTPGKIYFIGAGPGDPDLITVKGKNLLKKADIIIYAGSLVNPELLSVRKKEAVVHDSAGLSLDEILDIMIDGAKKQKIVARLQTGDISIFSALTEQIIPLKAQNIPVEVIPGVSSANASAAALEKELTCPEVSQTIIFTRMKGRAPVPEKENLASLAKHRATMCIFLSIDKIDSLIEELKTGYTVNTPVCVVYRASWPDQKILRGTLLDIGSKLKASGIKKQAMILVGEALKNFSDNDLPPSKLYHKNFTHGFRKGTPS